MKDILNIVGLLKQQAETALALATRRKTDALIHIEAIKNNIIEMGKSQNGDVNGLVYEHWCAHQRHALEHISCSLPVLDQDIANAFAHLETVQAKLTATQDLAKQQHYVEIQNREAAEEDAMLDLSLLRRKKLG